jgi:D-alanine-D-alanine ligase
LRQLLNSISYEQWANTAQQELLQVQPESLGKVGVLLGGRSAEREISLKSGGGVLNALLTKGADAHAFDPGLRSIHELASEQFDRVFIALHGRFGEDGTIQGLLEQLQIPYTGSGVLASAMAIDKQVTKRVWLSHGLATPKYLMLSPESKWATVVEQLGLPLIVKPSREGSSLGLSKVTTLEDLPNAYALAAKLDFEVMAEECIIGDELTCPIVGDKDQVVALPIIKIIAPKNNYDYHHKYFSNETQYICPPEIDTQIEAEVRALAVQSYQVLGCRGWGRADIMLDQKSGRPYLLEMNTSPGMTNHSLVPMAAKHAGMNYENFVMWILMQATLSQELNADSMKATS